MLITTRTAISDLLFCCCRCVRLMAGRLYRTLCFIRRFGTCLHSPLKGPRQLACQACVFTRCDDVARRIPQILVVCVLDAVVRDSSFGTGPPSADLQKKYGNNKQKRQNKHSKYAV